MCVHRPASPHPSLPARCVLAGGQAGFLPHGDRPAQVRVLAWGIAQGRLSSSAGCWREKESRDSEASTRRLPQAQAAQLMNLKQIHGCV